MNFLTPSRIVVLRRVPEKRLGFFGVCMGVIGVVSFGVFDVEIGGESPLPAA